MRRYFSLSSIFLFPYFRSHKLRVFITLFGIALGVGVFIAVQSASLSVRHSMRGLIDVISSGVDIELVLDRGGFDEEVLSMISGVEGIKSSYPLTVNRTRVSFGVRERSIFIFGIDVTRRILGSSVSWVSGDSGNGFDIDSFLSLPNRVVVGEGFLELHGITRSSKLSVVTARGRVDCYIAGVLGSDDPLYGRGNVIFMDIFASQFLFGKEGSLDRIDIELADGVDIDEVKGNLSSAVMGRVRVEDASGQLVQFGNFYKSFDLNLTVVSFISLLVGMYLIVNTLNTAFFQRRREIGILRSLGASRGDIAVLFLLKGFGIGVIGSFIGVLLGYFLAYFSLELFAGILHYTLLEEGSFSLSFGILFLGFGVGVLVSFFASLLSVLSSFRVMPAYNIRVFAISLGGMGFRVRVFVYISCILFLLSYISSLQDMVFGVPVFGFLSNFLIILGFSFLIPFFIERNLVFVRDYLGRIVFRFRGVFEFYFGIQNVGGISLGKNSIAAATLMISVGLIVNISVLIESYHYSIENWFRNVNNADVSIVSGSSYSQGDIFPMSEDSLGSLDFLSSYIEDIDYYRFGVVSYRGMLLDLHSFDLGVARRHVNYTFIEGDSEGSFRVMDLEDGVFVSEDVARRFNLSLGDTIVLDIGGGQSFKLAGIVVNYLSSKGIVSMSRKAYKKYFGDSSVDIFKIYLKDGVDIGVFRERFYEGVMGADTFIFSSMFEFKEEVLSSIDRTFLMFHVLSFITVFIAFMGIFSTLLASIVDRRREIGIFKALGASRGQVIRVILSQSVFIGIFSTLLGIASGFLLSFVTVFIINKQTVGWHLEYSFSFIFLVFVFIFFVFMSVLAGYYPAYRASLVLPREALGYE